MSYEKKHQISCKYIVGEKETPLLQNFGGTHYIIVHKDVSACLAFSVVDLSSCEFPYVK